MALTPGERITLIKRIGEALKAEEQPDIDLTLNTFNAPTSTQPEHGWTSEKYDYILRRLGNANSAALVGLHAHIYPDISTEAATEAPAGSWKEGHFRLFLSHTNANKQLAAEISDLLLDYGIDAFVAHDVIEPTREWMDEIEAALGTCDALGAILTEDFVGSQWCDQEIGFAVGRDVLIIAIRQGADPHGFISKYQAVPGDASPLAAQKIATGVCDVLVANDKTKAKMATATVRAYASSGSFDDARANLQRVKDIAREAWTDEMVETAERAGEDNIDLDKGDWFGRRIPDVLAEHLDNLLEREPKADVSDFEPAGPGDDVPF